MSTLNILCYFLLVCQVSAEKSAKTLGGFPLYATSCSFPHSLLTFNLWHFYYYVNCGLLWVHLVWGFLCFLTIDVLFLLQVREIFSYYSSNKFFALLLPLFLVGSLEMNISTLDGVAEGPLSSLFKILFFFSLQLGWFKLPCHPALRCVLFHSLICFWFPSVYFFIYVILSFSSD